jgi:cell division protease FtsH
MQTRKYLLAIVFAALAITQLAPVAALAQDSTAATQSPLLTPTPLSISSQPSNSPAASPAAAPMVIPGVAPVVTPAAPTRYDKSKSHTGWWIVGGIITLAILVRWLGGKPEDSAEVRRRSRAGLRPGSSYYGDPYDHMRPRGRILNDRERRYIEDEYMLYEASRSDEEDKPTTIQGPSTIRRAPGLMLPDHQLRPLNPLTPAEPSMEPRYKRQSQATLVLPTGKDKKSFADVAGQDETIARLAEICNWLKAPEVYNRHNAELPRGILFVGPPGTGKTLSAQALAGETHGSMFIIAASSFVEMYVGVGASRVRALFADAKAQRLQTGKPVIIFIDELDAVGGARNNGGSSNSEREQTLNQLLVEMDGFTKNEGIIVVAATNRVDILDPALRRKGRFDMEVSIDLPDLRGREAIFKVHTRDKVVAPEVDYALLARRTFGMSGADLKAAANEAAIIAAREQNKLEEAAVAAGDETKLDVIGKTNPITTAMFDEAISIVESGEARRERFKAMSLEDKKQTAYHELGHAVVIHKTGADSITKVTILPRGRALGYVQTHTENDRFNMTDQALRKRIAVAMAGRIAQEIFMQTVDTGASSDFEQANRLARKMVTEFGMSPLGWLSLGEGKPGQVAIGQTLADRIDAEVQKIINECAADARQVIEENRSQIESLVDLLIEKETIFGKDFVEVFERASA